MRGILYTLIEYISRINAMGGFIEEINFVLSYLTNEKTNVYCIYNTKVCKQTLHQLDDCRNTMHICEFWTYYV